MKIVNLTPHPITIREPDGSLIVTIEPSGDVARCTETAVPSGAILIGDREVPIVRVRYGDVAGLPAPEPDMVYIVSALVRQALPDRLDLCSPYGLVRDASGAVIGCTALVESAPWFHSSPTGLEAA